MLKPKKLCETNKEALRWCKTRKAKITFCEDEGEGGTYVYFLIHIGKRFKKAPTLIKTVNKWIGYFNKEHGT